MNIFRKKPSVKKDADKRDFLKEIEEKNEEFRLTSVKRQTEKFQETFSVMQNNFTIGEIDNKKQIKCMLRFIKTTHHIFLHKEYFDIGGPKIFENLNEAHKQINFRFLRFQNELYGIEKHKENDFLDVLNHDDSIKIKNSIFQVIVILSYGMADIKRFNAVVKNKDSATALAEKILKHAKDIYLYSNEIRDVIVKNLQEITDKEKIAKLKNSSEFFKNKSRKYRWNAVYLMLGAIGIAGLAVLSLLPIAENFFRKNHYSQPSSYVEINNSVFYVNVVLETLLSGRLLLSAILLTGFFYCLRFYAANQHNAIICEQRANTLESFEALYKNVEEDKERLLVVEKVLQSATEHLPTGFSKQQSDSGGIDPSSLLSLVSGSFTRKK